MQKDSSDDSKTPQFTELLPQPEQGNSLANCMRKAADADRHAMFSIRPNHAKPDYTCKMHIETVLFSKKLNSNVHLAFCIVWLLHDLETNA